MGKRQKEKHSSDVERMKIDDIVQMGGEKKDLELVGVEDVDEAMDFPAEDLEAEPIKRDELRDFIKQLGFDDVMTVVEGDNSAEGRSNKKDTKAKKKASKEPEGTGAEPDHSQEITQSDTPAPREKKKRNKYKVQDSQVSSTTPELDTGFIGDYQPRKYLLIKPGEKWHDSQGTSSASPSKVVSAESIKVLQDHATRLLQDEVSTYKNQQGSSQKSDVVWLRTVLTSGTLSDKMAALTLLVQEAPVHNLSALEQLVGIVRKRGRREALLALDTLKELFTSELLLDDRKLKSFDQQALSDLNSLPSGSRDTRDKRLISWHYEARLKDMYAEFVQALEVLCHDNILGAKQKALDAVFKMLASKPEQEKKLLSILVNKLGDPDYKLASKACHYLTKLVEQHPNMKHVVIAEVERLMYRPNVAQKAQYYAVCFLNQVILCRADSELALRLINIYFSFFKAYVKKGDVDSKMLSALLTGVNRAYPYAKMEEDKIAEQTDTLYKIVHIVNFNTSIQALMLLYQVMGSSERTSDRYYQALYTKLSDPGLLTSSKQAMFLNLLFKSLNKDPVDRRVKAFIKRLLQVCCGLPAPFVCGALVLLSEVLKAKPSLFQYKKVSEDSEDEEEHFVDVKTEEDSSPEEEGDVSAEDRQVKDVRSAVEHQGHTTVPSWVHRRNIADKSGSAGYDPHHRNPLYARAEAETVWELRLLTHHFHPSVALFAKTLLKGQHVEYSSDPLEDFTLIRFLDRFVFRNPKKRENLKKDKGGSTVHEHLQAKSRGRPGSGAKGVAINSQAYVDMEEADIPVDEKFFHRYFKKQAAKKKTEDEEIDSDVDDDEFDDFLDKYERNLDGADLDFAGELSKPSSTGRKSKKDTEEDSDDDDFGDDEDDEFGDGLSDEEVDFDGEDMLGEFDEESFAFSDDDSVERPKRKTSDSDDEDGDDIFLDGPPSKKKGRKAMESDTSNLFAAAEEFSHLMDESSSTKLNSLGTEALSNKDNADAKQLKWEVERNKFVRGKDWKSRRQQGAGRRGKMAAKHANRHKSGKKHKR